MTHSKNSAARKASQQKYRANSAKKKAEKNEAKREANARKGFMESLPQITEDNLLAFQFAHFGDDTKPNDWFVDPQKAINFEPEYEDEDDGLGYYDDGVKRTLTDEQIAMFRRSELFQMKRDQEPRLDEEAPAQRGIPKAHPTERAASPASVASSLEDDLLAYASVSRRAPSPPTATRQPQRQQSESRRSESTSTSNESWRRRRSKQEVPYEERHKRKWEQYIQSNDATEGSMTHRRLARELDDQQNEPVEMDY